MNSRLLSLFVVLMLASSSVMAAKAVKPVKAVPAEDTTQYHSEEAETPYDSLPRFRLGQIVDAGISQLPVNVANSEKLAPLPVYNKKVFVIVRVKLDPDRSISIHDFSLVYNYQAFDCVSIRPYQENFIAEKRVFLPSRQSVVYDMLFIMDMPDFKPFGDVKATLHYRLAGGGMTDVEIKLKNYDSNSIQLAQPPADDNSGVLNVPRST